MSGYGDCTVFVAALRQQASEAGIGSTGEYVEWLEGKVLALQRQREAGGRKAKVVQIPKAAPVISAELKPYLEGIRQNTVAWHLVHALANGPVRITECARYCGEKRGLPQTVQSLYSVVHASLRGKVEAMDGKYHLVPRRQ